MLRDDIKDAQGASYPILLDILLDYNGFEFNNIPNSKTIFHHVHFVSVLPIPLQVLRSGHKIGRSERKKVKGSWV